MDYVSKTHEQNAMAVIVHGFFDVFHGLCLGGQLGPSLQVLWA
jgi:hypothetical protein